MPQVLDTVNAILAGSDPSSSTLKLRARSYSVTPVGERVGLIEWVDHTVSFFAAFKAWQASVADRSAATAAARREASGGSSKAAPAEGGAAADAKLRLPPAAAYSRPADFFFSR
jgi:uncharacterized membrane protein